MNTCKICKNNTVKVALDFGMQPMSNRFLLNDKVKEFTHPLTLGYCQACSLVQLLQPAPIKEVKAHFTWIRYNEPEGHLDQVASALSDLPGVSVTADVWGISGKEGSLLKRLEGKGFSKTLELNSHEDLGIDDVCAGLETIQKILNRKKIQELLQHKISPTVVIARHLLEHAEDPLELMLALQDLVTEDGYIVFEVPDCTTVFESLEYSAIWEEHILYFTPYTFLNCLEKAGFTLHSFTIYPYAMENCMVAIVQKNKNKNKNEKLTINKLDNLDNLNNEINRIENFSKQFFPCKEWVQNKLFEFNQEGPMSLLGAGHLAAHFINLFNVKEYFNFVVDDHPEKINLYMPGSKLPILPSEKLIANNIKTCLLSLNQESEQKVIAAKQSFIQQGGQFFSIFFSSQLALQTHLAVNV